MITDAIITVEGLYKEFGHGKVHALNGVDAQVRKGEVLSCPRKEKLPLKAWTSPTAG